MSQPPQGFLTKVEFDFLHYMKTGSFYSSVIFTSDTTLTTGNTLFAIPFIVVKTTTFDRIAVHVSTLEASTNVRLGIYNDDGTINPGSRIVDAGTIDAGSTGVKTIVINQTLTPGLYWLASVSNTTTGAIRSASSTAMITVLGLLSTAFTSKNTGYSVIFAFGALPDPFPAASQITTSVPIIAVRPA